MTRRMQVSLVIGVALGAAACAEPNAPGTLTDDALAMAFAEVPIGYGDLTSSFVGVGIGEVNAAGLWLAGGRADRFDRGGLMGGGLSDHFMGGIAFGGGRGHRGPFGGGLRCDGATFSASTGRVSCPDETRNGLTIKRSAAYTTVAGAAQQAFDSITTNTVNLRSEVAGTITFDRSADTTRGGHRPHHGHGPGRLFGDTATILTASTTIASTSDRTVSGLAQGSTQRTMNGTSSGKETTAGTSSRGAFTVSRTVGDTTKGLIIPIRAAGDTVKTYPTAGTVIRAMQASATIAGQSPTSVSRREVITYDGSATAKVTITENGETRNCTRALPMGRLNCS